MSNRMPFGSLDSSDEESQDLEDIQFNYSRRIAKLQQDLGAVRAQLKKELKVQNYCKDQLEK